VLSFEDLERAQAELVIKDAKKTEKEAKKAAKEAKNVVSARTRGRGSCCRPRTSGRKRKNAASRVDAIEPTNKVSQISEAQVEHMSTRWSCCINSICV
jgi:hypothetical protein